MKTNSLIRIKFGRIFFPVFPAAAALLFGLAVPPTLAGAEVFTVALTGKYPPFSFYSPAGELVGFDVDISRAIAGRLGRESEFVTTEWDGILAGLLAGKYDAIIGSMAVTPERAKKVIFSRPYYLSGAQLFIHRKDRDKIKTIADCRGRNIGVGLGETYEHFLRENYPGINTVSYKGTVDTFQDMLNRRLAGFVTDRLVGLYQVNQGEMPFVPAGPLLYQEKMAIPVTRENTVLAGEIDEALKSLQEDGTLAEIREKWFGAAARETARGSAIPPRTAAEMLLKGFGITLLVAFTSILLGFILSVPGGWILNNHPPLLYHLVRSFNDFIRGTPLLIQLFFVYFGAPQLGLVLSPIQAAIFTLTVNTSAYMAEVVRSGLMAVGPGQRKAGIALGLSPFQVFRFVVWPQAFRIALPPLMNTVVALIKDTALIAMISVGEVIREAQSIISVTYDPMKYYFIVAAMFFLVTFPLMKLAGKIEKNIRARGFTNA
ncbi:MAG: ABC transporter substrate-binding protein/permease [Candidatus Erginobacter occultus]|nr:ABC transporter substrate-binding protein/permease [Candidatus Erginobacter occultus]